MISDTWKTRMKLLCHSNEWITYLFCMFFMHASENEFATAHFFHVYYSYMFFSKLHSKPYFYLYKSAYEELRHCTWGESILIQSKDWKNFHPVLGQLRTDQYVVLYQYYNVSKQNGWIINEFEILYNIPLTSCASSLDHQALFVPCHLLTFVSGWFLANLLNL